MTQSLLLSLTAALLAYTMLIHSVLGQRRLMRPLLNDSANVMQRPLARFIIPFAWHLTTLVGLIVTAVLLAWAWAPQHAQTIGLAGTGLVFTFVGIIDAMQSRPAHRLDVPDRYRPCCFCGADLLLRLPHAACSSPSASIALRTDWRPPGCSM